MGRQAQLVACNVAGFWVIGTLTGYLLAFNAHLGVSGLWIGINAGVFSCGELPFCVVPHMYCSANGFALYFSFSLLPCHLSPRINFIQTQAQLRQLCALHDLPERQRLSNWLRLSKFSATGFWSRTRLTSELT